MTTDGAAPGPRRGRPPSPVDPGASRAAALGAALRSLRQGAGLTQTQVAERVGYSAQHVGAVESGRTAPSLAFVRRCEGVLGGDGLLLALFPSVVQERALERHVRQERRRGTPTAAALPAVPAAAASRPPAPPDRQPPLRPEGVADLERVTEAHRGRYHTLPPAALVGPVAGHLRALSGLLPGCSVGLRPRLASMAAEAAGLLAWTAHDLGDRERRDRAYRQADHAAALAEQPGLAAYVRGFQALASLDDGRPSTALDLLSRRPQTRLAPRTSAWLAVVEGRARAQLGDRHATSSALSRAHGLLDRARSDEDPAWMFGFDEDRLLGERGRCELALGGWAAAEAALRTAVARPTGLRRRSELLVDLAAARLRARDLEESCHLAIAALAAAEAAGSPRGVERVRRFATLLPGPGHERAVAALDERLAAHA